MFRRWVVSLTASAVLAPIAAFGAVDPPDSPLCVKTTGTISTHITEVAATPLTARVTDYEFASAAMQGHHHVLVMTPSVYDGTGATRYPVLYLLHGHGGGARDWFNHGVESIVNDPAHPLIVVMPDGGYDGWYSDWYGADIDGHDGDRKSTRLNSSHR